MRRKQASPQDAIQERLADIHDEMASLDLDAEDYDERYVQLLNERESLELQLPPPQKKDVGEILKEEFPDAIASLRAHMARVVKHIRLGTRKVFKEQIEACMAILNAFIEGKVPLLIAQPQQGKTEACLLVVKVFHDAMRAYYRQATSIRDRRLSYESFYLTNIADNQIRKQTRERVEEAGLVLPVIHHAEIGKVEQAPVKKRLIIVDECHVALGRDKPFHAFLTRYGVEYGKKYSDWRDTDTWVLSVSATPYAHVIKTLLENNVFTPIVLPMSKGYYSLRHMYADERLKKAEPVTRQNINETNVTDFFRARMNEFMDLCERDGNGYLIVRARGASVGAIRQCVLHGSIRLASDKRPTPQVLTYDCQQGNIVDLETRLDKKPPCPTVIIIRGSLRAGKTLKTIRHIRLWIESAGSKTDTMTQVIGRCLGYKKDRWTSKFPVYCNLAEIDLALGFYENYYPDDEVVVPPGNWNHKFADKQSYVQHIASEFYDIPDAIRLKARIQKVSNSNRQDLALSVLNGSKRSTHSPIVLIDATNVNFHESWRELKRAHEDWVGCYAYYSSNGRVMADESKLRKGSLLREEKK